MIEYHGDPEEEDYDGVGIPKFRTGEDILDWVEEHNGISGGDPWLEGLAVDSKIIQYPRYLAETIHDRGFSRRDVEYICDSEDLGFWGIEFDEDDDEDEEDEDFEEAKSIILHGARRIRH